MKPKHQRLAFIGVSLLFLCAATLLALQAFRDNLVFFYTPSELKARAVPDRQVRVGGLVEALEPAEGGGVRFILSDGEAGVAVAYSGPLPALFRDGQGAVVEGYLQPDGRLEARRVLTKHDEYYMPKEVVEALKRSGRWRDR